jgi:surface protein
MKHINIYINEKLKISKFKKVEYTLFPTTFSELDDMIHNEIQKNGNNCSLNHIDVSKITSLSYLFYTTDLVKFNGDISQWDVSNVKNMESLFFGSEFTGDISGWDVSNVKCMASMFSDSDFNGDISGWDVSNVTDMSSMFSNSKFNNDISRWDVSNVTNMRGMFQHSKFNQDIFNWDISNVENMKWMFFDSEFNRDISGWKINKNCDTYEMFDACNIETRFVPKGIYN